MNFSSFFKSIILSLKLDRKFPDLFYFFLKKRGIPDNILIESTNSCNLRCPVCPTHMYMKREKGMMDKELFKSIIDELYDAGERPRILFNFAGEPTLNKDLPWFVEYAENHGMKTFLSANMTVLDNEYAKRLLSAGLSSIHLCIDGLSKDSHEGYRVGSDFYAVKKNIEDFMSEKKRMDINITCTIQTLLTSFSEKEIEEMIQWGKSLGVDSINFKSLSLGSYTNEKIREKYNYLLPQNKKYRRNKKKKRIKSICTTVLNQAVIFWNGKLGLCCIDFDSSLSLPSVREVGFFEAFNSDKMEKVRKQAFKKRHRICKTCSLDGSDSLGFSVKFNEK